MAIGDDGWLTGQEEAKYLVEERRGTTDKLSLACSGCPLLVLPDLTLRKHIGTFSISYYSGTVVRLVRLDRHAVVVGIGYWIYWSSQLVLFW